MPIETITKDGRRRLRWTFNRIIEGSGRIRQTKLLPVGTTQAQADALARRWETEIYSIAAGTQKPVVTIGDCVRKHIIDKQDRWKDADQRIATLNKWLAEYDHQDATELHEWSKLFIGYLRAAKSHTGAKKRALKDGTIRNILSYIRAAIKYAYKVGELHEDTTARMAIPPAGKGRHHYPERLEMIQIARKCENREVRAGIRIAFYSGMRRGEILRAVPTKKGYVLSDTKNGERRIVPIHPRIAVLARKIRFTIKPQDFSEAWDAARELAGYGATRFHDMRHGSASEMINSGTELYTVGAVLGHKSPVSTMRYAHLVTDRLAEAVGKIGKKKK